MKESRQPYCRGMGRWTGAVAALLAWRAVAGDLTVDNLRVEHAATVDETLKVKQGITYVLPLGDLSMGVYTNTDPVPFTLTNGLVAYWPMEENDADTNVVTDTVGGHTLYASRNTADLHASGVFGGAFLFDRTLPDQLSTTDWMPSTGADSWTVAFWWKSPDGGEWDVFTSWGQMDWNSWGHAVGLFTRSYGVNNFCVQDQHDTYWTSTEESDGNWHHLVATLDGSTRAVNLYVDGVCGASGTLTCLDVTGPPTFSIGGGYGGSADGLLDDFRVYNRALSAEEVEELYEYVP